MPLPLFLHMRVHRDQFTSELLPPSVENDCSNLQDFDLVSWMMKRAAKA
jgi:hypothetical protein